MALGDHLPSDSPLPRLSESPFSRLATDYSCSGSCSEDTRAKKVDPLGQETTGSCRSGEDQDEFINAANQMPVQSPPVPCAGKVTSPGVG